MEEKLSDCCGAKFYEDTDVCSDCKEHSEPSNEEMFVSMSYYTRIINVTNQNLYKI